MSWKGTIASKFDSTLDEATASLDSMAERMFYDALLTFPIVTIIMISHKVNEAMKFCNTLVEMENGRVKSSNKIDNN